MIPRATTHGGAYVDGGQILILGKLALTFGILLGWPLWDIISLERKRRREGRPRATWPMPARSGEQGEGTDD